MFSKKPPEQTEHLASPWAYSTCYARGTGRFTALSAMLRECQESSKEEPACKLHNATMLEHVATLN